MAILLIGGRVQLGLNVGGFHGNVELSGRQRQDARPGLAKMYAYRQTGPGGLPLALRLSEGLDEAGYDRDGWVTHFSWRMGDT